MYVREFFQHLDIRGITGLGLAPPRQIKLFKQNFRQLTGRVNIKGLGRNRVNIRFELLHPDGKLFSKLCQYLFIHQHAGSLHFGQHCNQRSLNLGKQFP